MDEANDAGDQRDAGDEDDGGYHRDAGARGDGGVVDHAGEIAAIDALLDACAASRARVAVEEARYVRLLARGWGIAQAQAERAGSRDTARRELPLRSLAAQLGVELRMNDRTVQTQLHDAWRLVTLLPGTVTAMEAGRIGRSHAAAILDAGATIDDDRVRAAFEKVVLDRAVNQSPAQTRAFARRLAEQAAPRPMQQRHDERLQHRSVWVTDRDDGMSELAALLPTALAHGILDRLTRQGKAIRTADTAARRHAREAAAARRRGENENDSENEADSHSDRDREIEGEGRENEGGEDDARFDDRTLDQTRADLLADLLLTGAPAVDPTTGATAPGGLGAITAHVQLTVPVTTLTGTTAGGAELDARAPVDPDTARRLAGSAPGWDRVMTHPVTGIVLAVDRYTPTAEQKRFLRARDRHCRWPGCRVPTRRCQLDHNHEHRHGGPTDVRNLCHLCTRHHTLKTETEWTVEQLPGGTLRFTAPTGRAYDHDPPPHVAFRPDPDPPPF